MAGVSARGLGYATLPPMIENSPPPEPSTAYLQHLEDQSRAAQAAAQPASSDFTGAPAAEHERLVATVESLTDELVGIVHTLHSDPETAYQEVRSAAHLADVLREHGHEVSVGAHGIVLTSVRRRA